MIRNNKRLLHVAASVAGACIVGYFLYHTIQGDRGWLAMVRLQNQVHDAEATLSRLKDEHDRLDHRVQMMRSNSLDPDLLDEQARKQLDYSKPGDIIVPTPSESKDNLLQRSK